MNFSKNFYQRNEPWDFYIARPNKTLVTKLTGIDPSTANTDINFIDLSELTFDVREQIYSHSQKKYIHNQSYDYLHQYMYIKTSTDIWFRISEEPTTHIDEDGEYKNVRCQSLECELMDKDIVSLVVNMANELSLEWFDDNLNAMGYPSQYISFINETDHRLSLLHLILEYAPNWKIGHVDIELRDMRRSLDLSSSTVYAILTQDVAKAFNCIFVFDTNQRTINAYKVENVGSDTNIYISVHTLIHEHIISPSTTNVYTQFSVLADEDKDILGYANFGSNVISNYDYFMNNIWFDEATVEKYKTYKTNIESKRQRYIELTTSYNELSIERMERYDRKPLDDCSLTWVGMSLEELQTELQGYQSALNFLISLHTVDGELEIEGTADYATYLSYKDVIIPKLQAQISAVQSGLIKPETEVQWEQNWDLYGINELQTRRSVYLEKVNTLKAYELPYDPDNESMSGYDPDYYEAQHELYLENLGYVNEINAKITELQKEVSTIESSMSAIQTERSEITDYVRIDNAVHGFTTSELDAIESLTIHTDYTNENILVTDYDDTLAVIELAKELYDSSIEQLAVESRPQLSVSTTLRNFLSIVKYNDFTDELEAGNFIHVGMNSDETEKLRVISISFNPCDLTEDLTVTFSNITVGYNKQDDYTYLLENGGNGSSKNSIQASITSKDITTALSSLLNTKFYNFINSSDFSNATTGSIEAALGNFNTILSKYLKTENLESAVANIGELSADSAFITYLQTEFASITSLEAATGDIDQLTAQYAEIATLLSGSTTTGSLQTIVLNAQNATIDSAFLKDLIAQNITVNDLKAGNINTNKIGISSQDGSLTIQGPTMQFSDQNGVRLQLGKDAEGNFNFILKNGDQAVILDENGLHEDAIADGMIKTSMVADGAITEDKIDKTNVREWTDSNGDKIFDVSKLYYGDDYFEVSYSQTKTQVSETAQKVEDLESKIGSIELMGEQIFKSIQGVVSPESITVTAVCRNNVTVGHWYIDDIENTTYVSADKSSITIPSSIVSENGSATVKVVDSTGQLFDTQTLYFISDSTGSDGQSSISVIITSSNGTTFTEDTTLTETICTCKVYEGVTEITPISYTWFAINNDGTNWEQIGTGSSITIPLDKTTVRKRIKCEVDVNIETE